MPMPNLLCFFKAYSFIELFAGEGWVSKVMRAGGHQTASLDILLGSPPSGKQDAYDLLSDAGFAWLWFQTLGRLILMCIVPIKIVLPNLPHTQCPHRTLYTVFPGWGAWQYWINLYFHFQHFFYDSTSWETHASKRFFCWMKYGINWNQSNLKTSSCVRGILMVLGRPACL